MEIGFYISRMRNLFDKQTLIYCYQNKPFEAFEVETGECSSFWDMKRFIFCKNQKELENEYINS